MNDKTILKNKIKQTIKEISNYPRKVSELYSEQTNPNIDNPQVHNINQALSLFKEIEKARSNLAQ